MTWIWEVLMWTFGYDKSPWVAKNVGAVSLLERLYVFSQT